MSRAQPAPQTSKHISFETPNLLVRTMTVGDATTSWAAWFDQAQVREGLNLGNEPKTNAHMEAYVRKFGQVSNH